MANWFSQWNQPFYNPDPRYAMGPGGYPTGPPPSAGYAPGWGGGGGVYTDAYNGRPPITNNHSTKYPTLNPILAADTTLLRFDIKRKPRSEILASTYYTSRYSPAKSTPTTHMRLISKAFPWSIEIHSAAGVNINCEMVWEALWNGLQQPLEDSEWGFLVTIGKEGRKRLEAMDEAVKKRLETEPTGDKRPKRIDYLGDVTLFKGLERDEDFEKGRCMLSRESVDTWVVKLTS